MHIKSKKIPGRAFVGLFLISVFWYVNWSYDGLRSHWAFFPLWLGYILTVDAWVFYRQNSSLYSRSKKLFVILFLLSLPFWWLFELFNEVAGYWTYSGIEEFSDLEYFLLASLSFSTVVPAMMESSELLLSFNISTGKKTNFKLGKNQAEVLALFVLGIIFLLTSLFYPEYSLAFIWLSIYLIIDPINHWLGIPNFIDQTAQGRWTLVLNMWIAALICGFFWEMWNYYSYPKWIYHLPFADFLYIFEMPILGYLGYLPFILDVFAFYHLCSYLFSFDKKYKYTSNIMNKY